MPDPIFNVAERKGADCRSDINEQYQKNRFIGCKAHCLIGVDGSKRYYNRNTALKGQTASHEPSKIFVLRQTFKGFNETGLGLLHQSPECRFSSGLSALL